MRRAVMLIGALWGPLYFVFFFATILEATVRRGGDPDNDLFIPFGVLMGLHVFTIVLLIGMTALYAVDAFRNPRVKHDQRVLWLIVLLLGGVIAMPIYWWLYVRRPDDTAPAPGAAVRPEAGRGFG